MAGPRIETTYIVKRIAPLKLALLCLATVLLCCNAPEAELYASSAPDSSSPSTTPSPSPSTSSSTSAFISKLRCNSGSCSWQLIPTNNARVIVVKSDLVDLLSSILASALVYFANESNMPYYYLPWLVLSLKAFLCNEGPAILSLGKNILLSKSVSASFFYLICIFVIVQQISVWCDVLHIFIRVWRYYIHNLPKERISFKRDANVC